MGKSFLRSKTVWVNLLTAAVGIGVYLQDSEILVNNPEMVAGLVTMVGLINVVLRLITKKPITSLK